MSLIAATGGPRARYLMGLSLQTMASTAHRSWCTKPSVPYPPTLTNEQAGSRLRLKRRRRCTRRVHKVPSKWSPHRRHVCLSRHDRRYLDGVEGPDPEQIIVGRLPYRDEHAAWRTSRPKGLSASSTVGQRPAGTWTSQVEAGSTAPSGSGRRLSPLARTRRTAICSCSTRRTICPTTTVLKVTCSES